MPDHQIVRHQAPLAPVIPVDFDRTGLSLQQIFAILKARRWLALSIATTVVGLTALAIAFWPRTYAATEALMVSYEVNDPTNGKELPMGQVGSYIATQVELMQTKEVLLAVIDRLRLTSDPEHVRGYDEERGTLRDHVAAKVAKTLAVYPSQHGSQLIYITYSARDPQIAARVASTVSDVYREQDDRRSTQPPDDRARRYAAQLADLKQKVDQAQANMTAFLQRNALIENSGDASVDRELLTTLESRLADAQSVRRNAEARTAGDPAVSDQVLASGLAQSLKTQIAAQEQKLVQLNRNLMPTHPDVIEAKLQLASNQAWLAATMKSYADNANAGLGAATRLERSLQDAVNRQRASMLAQGRLQDEAGKYRLELESAQTVYKRALEGYDQVLFASTGRKNNIGVVSRATPPLQASAPNVKALMAGGGAGALALALGLPLLAEMLRRRVRCRDDLERHHGIPVLAEFGRRLPEARRMNVQIASRIGIDTRPPLRTALASSDALLRREREPIEPALAPGDCHLPTPDPSDPRRQQIRALRTELLLRRESPAHADVIALLSPAAGDGRSRMAAELALAFAQTGHPTLLVDADLRRPRQHVLFGMPVGPGLADAIVCGGPAPMRAINGHPRLAVLPAGQADGDPLELLSSNAFAALIESWRNEFDVVLIDTAPVGIASDALAVAHQAGRVLGLTRAGKTSFAAMDDMLRRLSATRAEILGAVISHF